MRKGKIIKLKDHRRERMQPGWDLSLSPEQKKNERKYIFRKKMRDARNKAIIAVCAVALAGILGHNLYTSPWPIITTLKHWGARPNCDMARLFGLAPAVRGQPGYYLSHDRDRDGISCEPFPRR